MNERKRLLFSALGIMAGVAIVVTAATMWVLYCAAFEQQRARLVDSVKNEAHLIEAIARAHAKRLGEGHASEVLAATLAEVTDAHAHDEGFGDTGELTLARPEDDQIIFVLSHRHEDGFGTAEEQAPVSMSGWYAEPMRRALRGISGTVVGPDYRGETVLAAHEPIKEVNLGIVAKMDLAEIRAPFIRAGTIAGSVAILVIAAGAGLFLRTGNPLIKRLEQSEARMRSIVESAADGIVTMNEEGEIESFNTAAERIFGYEAEEVIGQDLTVLMSAPMAGRHQVGLRRYMDTGEAKILGESVEVFGRRKDGREVPLMLSVSVFEACGRRLFSGIMRDITERKRASEELSRYAASVEAKNGELKAAHRQADKARTEAEQAAKELAESQQRLLETSRRAGMAEVATGVLHNVGNVLNSVNVSASVVADKIRGSKVEGLAKSSALMQAHAQDLGAFMTNDERGRKLPGYLGRLAEHLAAEQRATLEELKSLTKNIDHIKDIVNMQQSYTGGMFGMIEPVSIGDLLEDALKINAASFRRHGVRITRAYQPGPSIPVDKHKLMQILINLISNAKHALYQRGGEGLHLTLSISLTDDRVRVDIVDNGVGIARENLRRIFSYGFTTKKKGHGFGLHSAALAAKELGGSLSVQSDGPGKGATFTLELPARRSGVPT